VIAWLPALKADVVNDAVPPEIVPVPIVTPPSWKVNVPVAAAGVTDAVSTSDAP
jgi:hypothetical protein